MQSNPIELLNSRYEDLEPKALRLAVLAGLESNKADLVNKAAGWLGKGVPLDEVVVLALGQALNTSHLTGSIADENQKRLEHWRKIYFGEMPIFRSVMREFFLYYFFENMWELDEGPVRNKGPETFNNLHFAGLEPRIAHPLERVHAVIDEATFAELGAAQYIKWLSRKLKKRFGSKDAYVCAVHVVCFSEEPPSHQAISRHTRERRKWYQFKKRNPFHIVVWDFYNGGFSGKTAHHFSPKTRTAINNRIEFISLNLKRYLAWVDDPNEHPEQLDGFRTELNYIQHVVSYMVGFNKKL